MRTGTGGTEGSGSVREIALLFLRLGTIAFGGPAAHTAMMREELVRRRGWVDDRRFLDLMGATTLIPGPNSTELAIHLGWDRGRWRGLVAAGVCFILPAGLIVTGLAWGYLRYGGTPVVGAVLYGIVPAVIAVIVQALVGLAPAVVEGVRSAVLVAGGLVAYLLGVNELLILLAGALAGPGLLLARRTARWARHGAHRLLALPAALHAGQPVFADPTGGQLAQLFATMLKIGSVLYGSGYVLLAFLRGDFVGRLGWITQQQLADAVSIGQATPGPVFTTATFVGYVVAGPAGAFVATVAIFLPSFVFVGLLTRLTDRLRGSAWTSLLLDGVVAVSVALMAGVTWQLGRTALVDATTVAIAVLTLVLLRVTRLNTGWYVLGGALVGLTHAALT